MVNSNSDSVADFIVQLSRLGRELNVYNKTFAEQNFITLPQLNLLQTIFYQNTLQYDSKTNENRVITAQLLAGVMQLAPQSIAHLVMQLVKSGYLTRKINSTDRRAWGIELTEQAKNLLLREKNDRTKYVREHILATCTPVEQDILVISGKIMAKIMSSSP